ncbi:hypothetical protein [Croceivirga sp. JEA036]|uniref:hypothetical protein n=1 Tax=Croceivirga sp. JEA036 TaxID=2721162 RepID=UPI00143B898D|nr:hypothetical protein [Croceivirga sp. JEA036]NJB37376.1 hypothetical protein [Croceivirga sp. JEA036]
MKTTRKHLNGGLTTTWGTLFLAMLFVASCAETPKKEKTPEQEKITEQEPTTKMVSAPKQIISIEEADQLFTNYTERRANAILKMELAEQAAEEKEFVPTRFVTFDINVLKEYIAFVEQEGKKGGTQVDSLRVYLGNYGKNKESWKKKKRNTVFFVPAAKTAEGYGGIFIGDLGKAMLIRDFFASDQDTPQQKASLLPSFAPAPPQSQSLILNVGEGGPPPRPDFQ